MYSISLSIKKANTSCLTYSTTTTNEKTKNKKICVSYSVTKPLLLYPFPFYALLFTKGHLGFAVGA